MRNGGSPSGSNYNGFKGCGPTGFWKTIDWKASLPATTSLVVLMRAADTPDALKTVAWTELAKQPPDSPPIDVVSKVGMDKAKGEYIELQFKLASMSTAVTPILSSITVDSVCGPK